MNPSGTVRPPARHPACALVFSLLSLVFSGLMIGIFTMGLPPFARSRKP